MVVGDYGSLVEEPRRRDVDILGWWEKGGWGGRGPVELWSGVVPRYRKSGESVSLGMGHSFTWGYHWS